MEWPLIKMTSVFLNREHLDTDTHTGRTHAMMETDQGEASVGEGNSQVVSRAREARREDGAEPPHGLRRSTSADTPGLDIQPLEL